MPIVKDIARIERDKLLGIGHSRTPAIMGELMATADLLHHFASAHEMFPQDVLDDMKAKARAAITVAGHKQEEFLNSEDPAQTFCQVIRQLLGTNQAHVRTKSGGIPANPTKYGWLTREKLGEHAQHEARGPKIGWIDTLAGEFYFDPAAVGLIKKHSDGKLMVTPQTLAKRMVEAGLVVRTDSTRQRNTVRMTLENHPHQVMVLSLSEIMGSESEPGPMDGDDAFESEATA